LRRAVSFFSANLPFIIAFTGFLGFILCTLWINETFYHFPGNRYFPKEAPLFILTLSLIYFGLLITLGNKNIFTQTLGHVVLYLTTTTVIILGCNAIQFTPFEPIDAHIFDWGRWFNFDLVQLMQWTEAHPNVQHILHELYNSLIPQMSYIPLVLAVCGYHERVREYCFLFLITGFIGFAFYYFFPTTAPASILQSPYFTAEQYATGLKFYQIHSHITPTTIDGGLIALPSFHVIWACLCTYLVRDWKLPFIILGTLNLGLIASCMLLGWHYLIDIVSGIAIVGFGYYVYMKSHH